MPVPSLGWHVEVTHPDTGRVIQPDVLDDPTILPSLNSLPEIRIPVRKSDAWLDPRLENNPDNPSMDVWLDGAKQPIDELVEVEDKESRTVLVGVGGTELRDRVQKEYRSTQRHTAAKNLITGETTYNEDVDTPTVDTATGETLQNPTTTGEFQGVITVADTDPIDISNGDVTVYQTCFTVEGEDADRRTAGLNLSDSEASGGAALVTGSNGDDGEWDFTPSYDIPADDFGLQFRLSSGGTVSASHDFIISGPDIATTTLADNFAYDITGYSWQSISTSALSSDLTAGNTYTVRIVQDGSGSALEADVVAPYDDGGRYGGFSYTFDNSLNTTDGYLDGPGYYPPTFTLESDDSQSAFSITDGKATITIDDTSGSQALQVSNDRGSNWYPNDGTENNTSSVDVTFPSSGSYCRLRIDLSSYSPSGTRNQTPRENYDAQTVSDWTLEADVDLELLLIDETYDDSIASVLTDMATSEYVWSYNLDSSGTPQVSWTQPGSRTANRDPDIGDVNITKNLDVFDRIGIKGTNRPVSGESFTASTSFVGLNRSNIVPGSETVYDSSANRNYDRGPDYEMDYTAGEIKITDGSDMSSGSTYSIDYAVETSGEYPSGLSNPDREFVDNVAGVTSDRLAEQIAYVLYDEVKDPRYAGDLTIPRADVSFDPLEALSLDNLDLPDEATPLEIRGEPQITPSGITLRLGSRGRLEQSLSSIAENVRQITKQT